MDIVLPYEWRPREYQEKLWTYLVNGGLRAVECAHRRWGKDDVAMHWANCAAHKRKGNYGHMLPEYAQGRKAIWDAVNPHSGKKRIDEVFPDELRAKVNDQEMKITLKVGSTWQVLGSDNYNMLMGTSYAGIVKSEEALSNPDAWGYLSPILRENGGWALFISSMRGRNHFYQMLQTAIETPSWFGEVSTVEDTRALTEAALHEELAMYQALHGDDYGRAIFMQEYYCSPDAAIPGSIWGDCVRKAELDGRVLDFAIDPTQPVFTAWDLGRTDDTAIWWYQITPTRIDVFDHHSSSMKDIPFYMNLLEDKRVQHGTTYGTHYLPHDARPRTLAAGGKSILQQCHDAAKSNERLGRFVIGKRLDVQEGIQAARKTFPFCRFHKTRTEKGVNSLRQYHREWDADTKVFKDSPEHDWCLDGDTQVLTRYGTQRIMDLPLTGEVLTSCGWKPYINSRITRRNAPLVAVEFSDGLTVKCTPDHYFLTEHGWSFAQSLVKGSLIQSSLTRSRSISTGASIVYGRARNIYRVAGKNCIALYGKVHSALFPRGVIFTTSTIMSGIITSPISNAFQQGSIYRTRENVAMPPIRVPSLTTRHVYEPLLGTDQRKEGSGIVATPSVGSTGRNGNVLTRCARHVGSTFKDWIERAGIRKFIAVKNAKWLQVERVDVLSERADVWCLTVPGVHDFSLANGAIVHNSSHDADAFRYLSLSWKRTDAAKPESPLVDTLLARNPAAQTYGQLRERLFRQKRQQREARA